MSHNTYETHFDMTKKVRPNLTQATYVQAISLMDQPVFFPDRGLERGWLAAELHWMDAGRPYYKIKNNIIESTERMKLDNIPCNYIDVPCEYNWIVILFPLGYKLRSMFAWKFDDYLFFMLKHEDGNRAEFFSIKPDDEPITSHLSQLKEVPNNDHGPMYNHLALQFYCLVKFLSNYPNEGLIEYDVLSKYKDKYDHGTAEERANIERKSRQRHKIGWNIGVNEIVKLNVPQWSGSMAPGPCARELTNSHIRTGHIHCVRCGVERKNVKVMWFRPTIVRPDLPMRHET